MESTWRAIFGFVTLLVFPLLGLLGMMKQRASPALLAAVLAWTLLGALALLFHWHPGATREDFTHGWLVGVALGGGFLAIDWLRTRRKISRWLKVLIGAITIAVFVKALYDFLQRYA
jgi:peptidoglycan/LPS O-acetylase OafA/YrhL